MVYIWRATGVSVATGLETTITLRTTLADGDTYDNPDLNQEIARTIAVSDAKTYLVGDVELEFVGVETEQVS